LTPPVRRPLVSIYRRQDGPSPKKRKRPTFVDGLDDLNVYTRRYHHGENPNAATEPIADGELHGFVKRTLEMTGGC
jgi:hypothetical protein